MKTFNESQMANPWSWCMSVIEKNDLVNNTKLVHEATGAPRSTLRSLFNGTNANPRYELLCTLLRFCIDLENGEGHKTAHALAARGRKIDNVEKVEKKKVASPEYDFL